MSSKSDKNNEEDRNIYVKCGNSYKPVGYWFESNHDWLGEGVWVVTKLPGVQSRTNGNYIKTMFGLDKVCDVEMPTFAEIAGMHKFTQYVLHNVSWDDLNGKSLSEIAYYIIGKMFTTAKELAKDKVIKKGPILKPNPDIPPIKEEEEGCPF